MTSYLIYLKINKYQNKVSLTKKLLKEDNKKIYSETNLMHGIFLLTDPLIILYVRNSIYVFPINVVLN